MRGDAIKIQQIQQQWRVTAANNNLSLLGEYDERRNSLLLPGQRGNEREFIIKKLCGGPFDLARPALTLGGGRQTKYRLANSPPNK
jgi:hypothetical protein